MLAHSMSRLSTAALTLLACLMIVLLPAPAGAQAPAPAPAPAPAAAPAAGCSPLDVLCSYLGNGSTLKENIDKSQEYFKSMDCWSCKVFNSFSSIVFTSGRSVSSQSDSTLKGVIVAVATLFAFFYLGRSFVSGDASDLLSTWKVVWRLLMAVALGTAWLSAGSFDTTWNYVYGPLLKIPLAVEQAVPGATGGGGNCTITTPPSAPSGGAEAIAQMGKVVCGANEVALKGMGFGLGLLTTGDGIVGTLANFASGTAILIVFTWIALTFPLKFIDVLLRLMVVGMVAPVLVVCAVFKPTRSYVQIGIKNVLYAGALFAFTGIMFKVGFAFINQIADEVIVSGGDQSTISLLARGIVMAGSGVIFASMINMAPSLAAEFSAFSGQSGGVGDAATSYTSSVVTAVPKAAGLAAGGGAAYVATRAAASGVAGAAESGAARAIGKGVTT